MQILTNLDEISFQNISAGEIELTDQNWARASAQFAGQIRELPDFSLSALRAHFDCDLQELPPTELREGYYGQDHLAYWLSGAVDAWKLKHWVLPRMGSLGKTPKFLDLGCSTGRVLRHLPAILPGWELWGADLNQASVQWGRTFLSKKLRWLNNASMPILPFESGSLDLVTAYSVFSHVEAFEDMWLLELKRVLRPGGFLCLTVNPESVWTQLTPGHALYDNVKASMEFSAYDFRQSMPSSKVTFHFPNASVYGETVIHSARYIEENWQPYFQSMERRALGHEFQDWYLFQK